MGQLRMGELLDGDVCSGRLSTILNFIGCRDEKWGMNKGNETKSEEEEDCKGRAHGDETRGRCGVQTKIDEDEKSTDVDGERNEKVGHNRNLTSWMKMILKNEAVCGEMH